MSQEKLEAPKSNLKGALANKNYKLVTFNSLLHNVSPLVAESVADNADRQIGRIAFRFFENLIQKYDPLVASAAD